MIRLEYANNHKEKDKYHIYHGNKKLDAIIVVSHITKNISLERFASLIDFSDRDTILYPIFKLVDEHIISEYKNYSMRDVHLIGTSEYLKWKNNNI